MQIKFKCPECGRENKQEVVCFYCGCGAKNDYVRHGLENVRAIKRVKTILEDDGSFKYEGRPIYNAVDLARIFKNISQYDREHATVLFLNNAMMPIGYDIFLGVNDMVFVDPRHIFKVAWLLNAGTFAVAHNHPSVGVEFLSPSSGDLAFAHMLNHLSNLMDMTFWDFLILNDAGYFSMREKNLIVK